MKINVTESGGKISKSHEAILKAVEFIDNNYEKHLSIDEIAAVLSIIDRNTPTGKRDFAMILLATVTGLRCVDICKLTFSDIDWINGELAYYEFCVKYRHYKLH